MLSSYHNHKRLPSIQLPANLPRPLWAYNYLPGGWAVLRREVLGETTAILQELEPYGDIIMTRELLQQIADRYELRHTLRQILVECGAGRSAEEICRDFRQIEDHTLRTYCIMLEG